MLANYAQTNLILLAYKIKCGLKHERLCRVVCKVTHLKYKENSKNSKCDKPHYLLLCYFKCFCLHSKITFSYKTSKK